MGRPGITDSKLVEYAARALLVVMVCALIYWLLGCASPQTPTPGGLTVWYDENERRLSSEKARELDARHRALLECLPPEALCTKRPPAFAIEGCGDSFADNWDGQKLRGLYYADIKSITLPPSLGAAAHEMTHHYTCTWGHESYENSWLRKCGDEVDKFFRRMYPPKDCEEA